MYLTSDKLVTKIPANPGIIRKIMNILLIIS